MKKVLITVAMICPLLGGVGVGYAQTNQSLNDNHFWKQQVAHKPLANTARLGGGINKPQSTVYLMDSVKSWRWDTIAHVWNKMSKDVSYVYDANNNNTSNIYQNWSGTAWDNLYLYTYTYDANNNQISYLQQGWNTSTSAWVNQYLSTYTYDVNNNRTSELDQNWNTSTSAWVNSKLYTYTYDTHNILATELIQTWSGTAWVNYAYGTTTTDVNNNIISVLIQAWSGTAWVTYQQNAYTYDVSNNNTSELYQTWSGTTWVNSEQYTYTYDASNNQTSELYQKWNTGTNAWVNSHQNTYTYDVGNPHGISNVRKYWNPSHTTAQPTTDSTHNYYRTVTTGINQLANSNEQVSIYPNPASTHLTLTLSKGEGKATIYMYDMLGELVKQHTYSPPSEGQGEALDVSDLAEGIYNISISSNEGVVNKRLVIVR